MEILTLVAAGAGVCLVPATVTKHYLQDDVVYVPVEDAEPAVVSLAWRAGALAPAALAFIETVNAVAQRRIDEAQAGTPKR